MVKYTVCSSVMKDTDVFLEIQLLTDNLDMLSYLDSFMAQPLDSQPKWIKTAKISDALQPVVR